MIVDFHVHSTASDGTCSPQEIAERSTGVFAALALTDHDNVDGVGDFLSAQPFGAGNVATRRFAGVELSIDPGVGFDKFHLLGLGISPTDDGLRAFLKKVLVGRNARNQRMIENFRRLGFEMGDEIFGYAHGDVLARPHFACWLMDRGFVTSVTEAFAKYLLPDSPSETRCYEERFHPAQEEAFRVIHAAGGLCVMAHPKYWRRYWRETGPEYVVAEAELARLKEMGLDGLEAYYQANQMEENVAFSHMADRLGLLKTAGSDFHGTNKPTITLGMEVSDAYIGPFLERIS